MWSTEMQVSPYNSFMSYHILPHTAGGPISRHVPFLAAHPLAFCLPALLAPCPLVYCPLALPRHALPVSVHHTGRLGAALGHHHMSITQVALGLLMSICSGSLRYPHTSRHIVWQSSCKHVPGHLH